MSPIPIETALLLLGALVLIGLCRWIGFRWRSFLLLIASLVVGAGIGQMNLEAKPHEFLYGISLFFARLEGAMDGGSLALVVLGLFHVMTNYRQRQHLRGLVRGARSESTGPGIRLTDEELTHVLSVVEEQLHVKYVVFVVSQNSKCWSAFEDWEQILEDQEILQD